MQIETGYVKWQWQMAESNNTFENAIEPGGQSRVLMNKLLLTTNKLLRAALPPANVNWIGLDWLYIIYPLVIDYLTLVT